MKPEVHFVVRHARRSACEAVGALADELSVERRAAVSGYVAALLIRIREDFAGNESAQDAIALMLAADDEAREAMFRYDSGWRTR